MTLMRDEALSCGRCASAFLMHGIGPALTAGQRIRERGLRHIEVLGRGSSSHAGTVLRYAMARRGGLRVGAAMPSVAAYERSPGVWTDAALVAISQSGKSPDLVRFARAARDGGALLVALINSEGSPLAAVADLEVPLCAGPELAVAATKSTVMAAMAGLALVAGCTGDDALAAALQALPQRLDEAATADWSALTRVLPGARAVYIVGRGCDLGIAKELALKIAEAVGVPALAFSSAEFLHGPLGAVSAQTPVLGLGSDAGELASVITALQRARSCGAATLLAHGFAPAADVPGADLWLPRPEGSSADALLALVPAYLAIEAAALAAGRNPDSPPGLAKVTETL